MAAVTASLLCYLKAGDHVVAAKALFGSCRYIVEDLCPRLGIGFTEGVGKRGMSLERFADITATNAAKIFGLYPRKGVIAPGSDADFALIDPAIRKTLAKDDFHVTDYSPWEGWQVTGWPVVTILRGRVIADHGKLLGSTSDGRLLTRKLDPQVLQRPVC